MSNKNNAIELADVIEGLRNEMQKAQEKGKGEDIRFKVNHVEVELQLTIAKKNTINAEIKAGVDSGDSLLKYFVGKIKGDITTAGGYEYENITTQKITLNLSAKDSEGNSPELSNDR